MIYSITSRVQVQSELVVRSSLIFSHLTCTVFNLILFLTELYKDLNNYTVEKNTSQVHGTGIIWKQRIPALYQAGVY